MNSGDNSDQMPAKASVEAGATEDPTQNQLERPAIGEQIPKGVKVEGQTEKVSPAISSPTNEDGGERRTMQIKNMGSKVGDAKSTPHKTENLSGHLADPESARAAHKAVSTKARKSGARKTPVKKVTVNDPAGEEQTLNVIKTIFGPNVKLWFEAQDIHLKREEAQKAFSATIESLCKDRELKDELKALENDPLAPNPLAVILKRCVDRNYLLGTKDLKKFEKELKRFNFDLGTTHLTLKGFMHFSAALRAEPIQQLLRADEWQSLPREMKFIELLLDLNALGLVNADDNTGNLYTALPPELKKVCGRFDGDLKELINLRSLLEKDAVKKHLNGTRLAGQSPEDRFLSLLLNLVEKEGLDPETDYRLVYSALPLKRKADLIDSHIKINYLTQLRKALERDSLKKELKEWNKLELTPEEKFVEFVLTLRAEKLISPEMSESQVFAALPTKLRSEMKLVEKPYADIANFRAFFSGQSVQARLHMLVGSDKTPWEKFEELNALVYDPTNEATRGILKGTPPADYFELHSWLPPHLRKVTSPYPDEEDLEYEQSVYQSTEAEHDPQVEELEDHYADGLTYQSVDNVDEDTTVEILKPTQILVDNQKAEPAVHGQFASRSKSESFNEEKAYYRNEQINMNKPEIVLASDNHQNEKAVQVRVSLGFTPRFGDHSIRQKTSLNLQGYRQHTISHTSSVQEVDSALVFESGVNDSKDDLLVARDSDSLNNLYRPGRTWGDPGDDLENDPENDPENDVGEDLGDEIELEVSDIESKDEELQNFNQRFELNSTPSQNLSSADSSKVIELGFSDTHKLEVKSQGDSDNVTPYKSETLVSKDLTSDGWERVSVTSNRPVPTAEGDQFDRLGALYSENTSSVMEATQISAAMPSPAEPPPSPTKDAYDPETSDSVSDHLAYTGSANITPEERLMEFAVFLNRNKMLAATNSFKELYEKLPADIKPGFKTVDLELTKFIEFRQDISRHFVKEHLRSTKEKGLEGEDRFAEFISFLKKNGLMPTLTDSADLYKLIPIELKKEFGNILSTEPVNLELRKNLEMEVVKQQIATLECATLPPEDRLVELGIFLQRNGLAASLETLGNLHIQLPFDMRRNFKRCDANLKVITSIRSVLEKEMIKEHLRNSKEAGISDEERFIELVIFLERNELVVKGTSPGDIYTALPSYLKSELKRCDFPSEAVIQVRDCLDKPAVQQQVELLKKMWFSNQEKFMELAVFMKQNGYMPSNADATLLYCGLPANLKKDLSIIDMPLDAVVQLRKNLEREFVKAHIKSSENDHLSPEERFVELIVFLYRNELMPEIPSLDDVYTALPSDLRLEFSRTEIPLEQILLFRDILDKDSVRKHWNQSRTSGGSGEDRFADLVVFLKKEGLLLFEDNLGYFYTALPVEFKRELSNFIFKVDTITRLKSAIKAAESSASF